MAVEAAIGPVAAQPVLSRADFPDLDAKRSEASSPRSSPGYIEMCTATAGAQPLVVVSVWQGDLDHAAS